MSLYVLDQVIRAHKRPRARRAHKLFLSCVRALVSRKLVAARKSLSAVVKRATERFLSSMNSKMGLQVGQLVVAFVAPEIVADEGLLPGVGGRQGLGVAALGQNHQVGTLGRHHKGLRGTGLLKDIFNFWIYHRRVYSTRRRPPCLKPGSSTFTVILEEQFGV